MTAARAAVDVEGERRLVLETSKFSSLFLRLRRNGESPDDSRREDTPAPGVSGMRGTTARASIIVHPCIPAAAGHPVTAGSLSSTHIGCL